MKLLFNISLFLCFLIFANACSCERFKEAKQAVNNVKNLADAAEEMQESVQQAEDRMEERKKSGDTLAIHYEELAEFLPGSFQGYEPVGDMQGGTTTTPGMGSYSNVSQDYENAAGDRLSVSIVDYNAAYALYSTIMAAYVSGFEIDNTEEHIKGFKLSDDVKGWTVHKKKQNRAEAYTGVSDRFHITVEADNQNGIDFVMDVSTEEIPVDKLAKM